MRILGCDFGCGCLIALIVGILVGIVAGAWGILWVMEHREEFEDSAEQYIRSNIEKVLQKVDDLSGVKIHDDGTVTVNLKEGVQPDKVLPKLSEWASGTYGKMKEKYPEIKQKVIVVCDSAGRYICKMDANGNILPEKSSKPVTDLKQEPVQQVPETGKPSPQIP